MNKKYIIVLGVLILSLIILVGMHTYIKQDKEAFHFSPEDPPKGFIDISNFIERGLEEWTILLEDMENLASGALLCFNEDHSIFTIGENDKSSVLYLTNNNPKCLMSDRVEKIYPGYIGVFVDAGKVIEEHSPTLLEEGKLNICSIIEPSLIDFKLMNTQTGFYEENSLLFQGANVVCHEVIVGENKEINPMIVFLGFVPPNLIGETLKIDSFFVSKDTETDILGNKSLTEIRSVLETFPLFGK